MRKQVFLYAARDAIPPMKPRILLVEDSAMISGALKMLLEAGGFDVTLAASAADAEAWDGPSAPDVMLLDVGLPVGDGLSVISTLEGRGLLPPVTYAITGHGDEETRARCIAAGCDDVLIKPVPVQLLLRIVSEATA
jgi:DNA-binding response OmpR family regulator